MKAFIQGDITRYAEVESALESLGFSKKSLEDKTYYSQKGTLIHLKKEHVAIETPSSERGYFIETEEDNLITLRLDKDTPSIGLLKIIAEILRPSKFLPLTSESRLILPDELKIYSSPRER